MSLKILDIAASPELKPAWRDLFDGYSTFYKRQLTDAVAERVWAWLMDPGHELEGKLALINGSTVGLAHFRRQRRPGFGEDMGYLDDLFVSPDARSGGVGRALIEHIREVGRARGWRTIRWTTADDNYPARALYDQLAVKATFNIYEMTIGDAP